MIVTPVHCRIFRAQESLPEYLFAHIYSLPERSVVVVTSKIVALAQGRVVPNGRGRKARIIKQESEQAIKTRWCYLTLKDGHWCPNAGVDESNAEDKLILWPTAPYEVAAELLALLKKKFHREHLGVLITDSRTFPLRSGVTGVALGYAGFGGLRDYRGTPDIFGRVLRMTQTNIADSLATTAVLVMGEGNEQYPLAVITDPPISFGEVSSPNELFIDPAQDMYRPLFASLERKKTKR